MQMMVLKESRKLGIDNSTATLDKFMEKFVEEYNEVRCAFLNEDMGNMQEEILDVMQVCIGMLDKLENEGYPLRPALNKHHKKLVQRGWSIKKIVNFNIINWGVK